MFFSQSMPGQGQEETNDAQCWRAKREIANNEEIETRSK